MNAQSQDQSFYTMIAEHQQLTERVLRLDEVLSDKKYNSVLPAVAHKLIKQMKDIVITGSIQTAVTTNPNVLPFIDPEPPQNVAHEFEIGDIVCVPSRMAQHKFCVRSKQHFIVERFIGAEQLELKCICDSPEQWKGFNLEIIGHYTHFEKLG